MICLVGLEIDAAGSEIDRGYDLDAELILRHLDEFFADVALERLRHVFGIAEQIGRGQQRPCRNLLRNIRRREIAQIEVVTLERDQLRALFEKGVAPVRLKIEVVFDRRSEGFVGFGAQIGFRERAAEAKLLPGLREGWPARTEP